MTSTPAVGQPWDLLVVGGGTAGLVAAKTAARLGARVLLTERARTGGDCLWTGCVPSKALLAAAGVAARARAGARFGIDVPEVRVDFGRVMGHVRAAIAAIEPADSVASLHAVGVAVQAGHVRFVGPTTARVGDGAPIRFRQAVLATGAAPALPPIPGLAAAQPLTSDTVWDLTALPRRLAVLGAGSVGCELGQAFARLGAEVVLVEVGPRLLPREDPDAAAVVHRALHAEGVHIRTGARVAAVRRDGPPGAGVLVLDAGDPIGFDRLLVAVGRTPRTAELGLDVAGVRVDARGFVVVDEYLRTSNPRIRAAGDVTGHPQFTHVAGVHGSLAASNAVLGLRRSVDSRSVPRVTFTDPELAAVGVDTGQKAENVGILTLRHDEVDRAVIEGATDGLTRLALDRRGRIVGASVVSPRAGETLGELTVAVRRGLRPRDLAAVVHAYPTWNDGPWHAVLGEVRAQLERPLPAQAAALAVRVRRSWLDARRRTERGV